MRLCSLLLRIGQKNPGGHLFRGKYRLVKKVTRGALEQQRRDFDIEESNMLYLKYPYLTKEQSHGHSRDLKKAENRMDHLRLEKLKEFQMKRPHVRIEDRLGHLRYTDAWE